ncbi:MAG: hypothetical protein AAGG07_04420 [Planctomycetota bacterium]
MAIVPHHPDRDVAGELLFTLVPRSTIADQGGDLEPSAAALPGIGVLRWTRDRVPLSDDGRVSGARGRCCGLIGAQPEDVGVRQPMNRRVDVNGDGVLGAVDVADPLELFRTYVP